MLVFIDHIFSNRIIFHGCKRMNYIFRDCTRSTDRMQTQQQESLVPVLYQPTSSAKTTNCGSGTRVAMPRTTDFFFSLLLTKRTSFSFFSL